MNVPDIEDSSPSANVEPGTVDNVLGAYTVYASPSAPTRVMVLITSLEPFRYSTVTLQDSPVAITYSSTEFELLSNRTEPFAESSVSPS